MSDDNTPRVTLRGEFLRAERHLARAVEAESQVERLAALADRLADRIAAVEAQLVALDELATPETTPNGDMRSAFALAARSIRSAIDERDPARKGGPPVPGKDGFACLASQSVRAMCEQLSEEIPEIACPCRAGEAMARAWDEGHASCCDERCFSGGNPHR